MKRVSEYMEELGSTYALVFNYAHKRKLYSGYSHEQNDICWHIIGKMEESYSSLIQFCSSKKISHRLPDLMVKDPSVGYMKEEAVIKKLKSTQDSIDYLKSEFPGSKELKRCDLMTSLAIADLIDLIQCVLAKS